MRSGAGAAERKGQLSAPQPLSNSVILEILGALEMKEGPDSLFSNRMGMFTPVGSSVWPPVSTTDGEQPRSKRQLSFGVKGAVTVAEVSCGKSPWQLTHTPNMFLGDQPF